MSGPTNKREARKLVRAHWADLIKCCDMGAIGDMANDHLDAVWDDECKKIAKRISGDTK